MKLIKARDGTLKCRCRVDFVIMHNGEVQCSHCGQKAGYLSDTTNTNITQDKTELSDKDLHNQIQFNNNLLHYLESSLDGVMISDFDRKMVSDLKDNIHTLKQIRKD